MVMFSFFLHRVEVIIGEDTIPNPCRNLFMVWVTTNTGVLAFNEQGKALGSLLILVRCLPCEQSFYRLG